MINIKDYNYTPEQLKYLEGSISSLQTRMNDAVEKIVVHVLSKHLNKDGLLIGAEDFKKCTRFTNVPQDYIGFMLSYDNQNLGKISINFPDFKDSLITNNEFIIKFDPA